MEFFCYAYGRLSKEDLDKKTESDSIRNQRDLIHAYIDRDPELHLVMEGYDDGYTGTSFDRPHVREMLEAVQSGKVNCVVVKDLSRFGREYIESGQYIEKLFPALGVRFIAINDNYDTAHLDATSSLMLPFKNLMNDSYCSDISIKIRSNLDVKRRNGEFIGSFAVYGYAKDPENKNRLVVDPEAAEVVRSIFQKKLEGVSNAAIVRWLNNSGILSPCCYRHQKGILLDHRYAQPKPWKAETVKNILRSQAYLGHMVQGHRRSEFYAGIPDRLLPRSEWVIVKNTHEAIISQEDFDRVQSLCETKRREYYANLGKYDHLGKSENILKGLVYCGDCGRPMVRYKQVVKGKKVSYHYMCPHYAAMLEQSGCAYKFLREDILLDALSQLISKEMEQAVDTVQMAKRLSDGTEGQITARAAELRRLNLELERMETRKKAVMQDFLAGELSCDAYEEIKTCCVRECEQLKERILTLRGEQHCQSETLTVDNPWLKTFSGLQLPDRMDRNLACALIQRITIYAENKIEVIFKYQDEREHLLTAINEEVSA